MTGPSTPEAVAEHGRALAWLYEAGLTVREAIGSPSIDDAAAFFEDVPPTIEWSFDEHAIAQLTVPILYVLVENSRPGHRDSLLRLQQLAPQTESALMTGTTHMLHTDRPDLVAGELASFFARHSH